MEDGQRRQRVQHQIKAGMGEIVEVEGGHIVRSTGRKDRHSKVFTAKGLRDRRVRLSAHTAIQFYDVQDRLGYDRPSKAVDWLIKHAKAAIDELAELPPWNPLAGQAPVQAQKRAEEQTTAPQAAFVFGGFEPELFAGQGQDLRLSLQQQPIYGGGPSSPNWPDLNIQAGFPWSSDDGFAVSVLGQGQFLAQRGPLQSIGAHHVRAWPDMAALPTSFAAAAGGFSEFRVPTRIHGEEERDVTARKASSGTASSGR